MATSTTAIDSIRHMFPCFDLPKERYGTIRDFSLDDADLKLKCRLLLEALVSKRLEQEVEERAQKHSRLTIKDKWVYDSKDRYASYEKAILPTPATKIRNLSSKQRPTDSTI